MLALTHVVNLFSDELTRLRGGRLPLPRVFSGPLYGLPFRHLTLLGVEHSHRTAEGQARPTGSWLP